MVMMRRLHTLAVVGCLLGSIVRLAWTALPPRAGWLLLTLCALLVVVVDETLRRWAEAVAAGEAWRRRAEALSCATVVVSA